MKFIYYIPIFCGALFLSACEDPEVNFCKRWIVSTFDEGTHLDWQKVDVRDRSLTPLEAQRTVFPNYEPDALYKRRPDNIPSIIYALGVVPAELRLVNVQYDVMEGADKKSHVQSCEFLRLSNTPQHITNADFYGFKRRRYAGNSNESCCIRKNEDVR